MRLTFAFRQVAGRPLTERDLTALRVHLNVGHQSTGPTQTPPRGYYPLEQRSVMSR